jgi:hypothetical protein
MVLTAQTMSEMISMLITAIVFGLEEILGLLSLSGLDIDPLIVSSVPREQFGRECWLEMYKATSTYVIA